MKDFQIYLAGGMMNLTEEEQRGWRYLITEALKDKSQKKLEIINPLDYYNFSEVRYRTQREVMEFDLHKVVTSDLVIVNFNDKKSIGTAMELAYAKQNNIPVIGICDDGGELHPWLVEHCMRICESAQELIDYVCDFFLD